MKKLTKSGFAGIAVAALLAVVGLAPTANAQLTLVGSNGVSYIINFDGYSMGSVYTAAPGIYGSPNPATGVGLMDAVPKLDQRPSTPDTTPGAIGSEDTWGILRVANIVSGGNTVWQAAAEGSGGQQIRGMFYGGQDYYAQIFAGGTQVFNSVGIKLDLYLSNTTTNWGDVRDQLEGGRTGLSSYTGVTTIGTQILGAAGIPGFFVDDAFQFTDADASFHSVFNPNGTAFGSGRFGINTQNINPPLGPISDFTFANNSNPTEALGWTVFLSGNSTGTLVPVPEPSTYGLIAAGGLLALVTFRRMKARAQAV